MTDVGQATLATHPSDRGLSHGLDVATGRMVAVAEVESGLGGLVCPACQRRLIAAKGDVYRHHFRHQADDMVCAGALETMLHKVAKQVIAEARSVMLPPLEARWKQAYSLVHPAQLAHFDSVLMEVARGLIRPDLVCAWDLGELAVEVQVTHGCGEEKVAAFGQMMLPAVEIAVAGYHEPTHGNLANYVIRDAPRWWLFHPEQSQAVEALRAQEEAKEARRKAFEEAARAELEASTARHRALAASEQEHQRLIAEEQQRRWQQEEAIRQKLIRQAEEKTLAAEQAKAERYRTEITASERSIAYWESLTPEQNAAICEGLKKGFDDHYWKLRDRPEVIAMRSVPPTDDADDAAAA